MSRRTLDDMPRIVLSFDIPNSDYEQLEKIAQREGVRSVRSLLTWTMRADIVERARQVAARHTAAIAAPTNTAAA